MLCTVYVQGTGGRLYRDNNYDCPLGWTGPRRKQETADIRFTRMGKPVSSQGVRISVYYLITSGMKGAYLCLPQFLASEGISSRAAGPSFLLWVYLPKHPQEQAHQPETINTKGAVRTPSYSRTPQFTVFQSKYPWNGNAQCLKT